MKLGYLFASVFLALAFVQSVSAQEPNTDKPKKTVEAIQTKTRTHAFVQLAIEAEVEFFGEQAGETKKKSTKTSVVLPVSGSAKILADSSGYSKSSLKSAGDERNAISTEVYLDLESVNRGVVFTLLRINQVSSSLKAGVSALKMQVAAPLGKSETATMKIQEQGSPGSVKSVRLSLSPSAVEKAHP